MKTRFKFRHKFLLSGLTLESPPHRRTLILQQERETVRYFVPLPYTYFTFLFYNLPRLKIFKYLAVSTSTEPISHFRQHTFNTFNNNTWGFVCFGKLDIPKTFTTTDEMTNHLVELYWNSAFDQDTNVINLITGDCGFKAWKKIKEINEPNILWGRPIQLLPSPVIKHTFFIKSCK